MKKRVPFFAYWDLKSIKAVIAIIVGIGLLFYFGFYRKSSDTLDKDSSHYNMSTSAIVKKVEKIIVPSQSRYSSSGETMIGYSIYYIYTVNGKEYEGKDYMNDTTGNVDFLNYCNDNIDNEVFVVKYAESKPEDCFLVKEVVK